MRQEFNQPGKDVSRFRDLLVLTEVHSDRKEKIQTSEHFICRSWQKTEFRLTEPCFSVEGIDFETA